MRKFLRRVKRKIMIHKLAGEIADLILMGYSCEEMEPVIRHSKEIIDGMAK